MLESQPSPVEQVRCVDCHAVYEKTAEASPGAAAPACPDCGGVTWLAADIPLPDSGAPAASPGRDASFHRERSLLRRGTQFGRRRTEPHRRGKCSLPRM